MPRAYTEAEQEEIRARLISAGRTRFTAEGLDGVRVADLTRDAGIGKGSFYLFFESKEALFFAVQEEEEVGFKAELEATLGPLEHDPVALLEAFFILTLENLDRHPFLRRVTEPGVIERLQAKVPPAVLMDHQARDRAFFTGLVRRWIERGILPAHTDPQVVFGLAASMFALALSRDVIGPAYPASTRRMARALARDLAHPTPVGNSP